ncbi:MAG: acetylglutamate kinase [Victivallales bacterium]|nr:acetylglutamate kinase [Victivallales bacterium]
MTIMQELIGKSMVLIEALPYMQKFRGAIVVIKFGGSAMEDEPLTKSTMRDIVFMECVGMKPVVVHGGGKAISTKLKDMDIPTRFINGLRYTCERSIAVVDDVMHNVVNKNLVDAIGHFGGSGKSLSGKEILKGERIMTICPDTGSEVDLGFVGQVSSVDTGKIIEMLEAGVLPVIAPLAVGGDGQVLNVNADMAACRIAQALKARKLVFLSDVPGILSDPEDEDSLITTITLEEVDELIERKVISGGMAPKIKSAEEALRAGTNKVHIVDGRVRHSLLLEIFTDTGIGTQIIKSDGI